MSYRSLALAVVAFSTMHVANADAQPVYVAPGGVYIGGGPVYVIPAPNGAVPFAAPSFGYPYGPPAVVAPPPVVAPPVAVAPPPAVVAPTAVYGPDSGYYGPDAGYYGQGAGYYGPGPGAGYYGQGAGYYEAPFAAYNAAPRLRPPAPIPNHGNGRCVARYGYDQHRQVCY
jgi:hypothetical protein